MKSFLLVLTPNASVQHLLGSYTKNNYLWINDSKAYHRLTFSQPKNFPVACVIWVSEMILSEEDLQSDHCPGGHALVYPSALYSLLFG